MDILTLVISAGILQGIVLGIFLLTTKKGHITANRVKGILIIMFSVSIMHAPYQKMGWYAEYPHFLMISHTVLFLFGPLFYLYSRLMTDRSYKITIKFLPHLLPFIMYVIYLIPFFMMSGEQKIAELEKYYSSPQTGHIIASFAQILQLFVYLYFIYSIIQKHETKIKNIFSSLDRISLDWIRKGIIGFVVVYVVMMAFIIMSFFGYYNFLKEYSMSVIAIMVSAIIYYIGYMGIQNPEIVMGSEESDSFRKTERAVIPDDKADKMLEKLFDIMSSQKPYRNCDLTIKELAEICGVPGYQLSQLINERLKQNFFDFINRYRVDEAKTKLLDPKLNYYSVLAIAYDAGFKSKSVFNSSFKKYTGVTPSSLRKESELESLSN